VFLAAHQLANIHKVLPKMVLGAKLISRSLLPLGFNDCSIVVDTLAEPILAGAGAD